MNELLSQLYDIENLDPISLWPLAAGWWILIAITIFAFLGIFTYYYQKRKKKRSWQRSLFNQLSFLEIHLKDETAQATLIELSELIRRIAIHLHSRAECAGLEGEAWLTWLKNNDPHAFDWERRGKFLKDAPYAPSPATLPLEDIRMIIKSIKKWIK